MVEDKFEVMVENDIPKDICTSCRLHETAMKVCQMGQGNKKSKIMVVQENPFENENKRNQYMMGKAGQLFKAALGEVGVDLDDVYFTALVKCPTPDDRIPLPDECKACLDYLLAEIDIIQPEIIIPTGNLALKFLTGLTGITKQRGRLMEIDGNKYFPILSPQSVLKQPKYMDWFSKDMINLAAILEGNPPPDVLSFESTRLYCETFQQVVEEIDRLMDLPDGTELIVDLETVKNNPFIEEVSMGTQSRNKYPASCRLTRVVAIGLSDSAGYGCSIPLYHYETPLLPHETGAVVKLLRHMFETKKFKLTGHNLKFDMRWMRASLGIDLDTVTYDTMLMHYLGVTEEKGTHVLKQLAWLETDMGGYDDALDKVKPTGEDEGNYGLIPWDTLKIYLADDCDCTARLLSKYKGVIEGDEELNWLWTNIFVPISNTLLDLECNGLSLDREWLAKLQKSYPEEITRVESMLQRYPEVLEIEREMSEKWEIRRSIGLIPRSSRTTEQQEQFERFKKFDPKDDGTKFNFGSTAQLQDLLFNRMGLTTTFLTDKGKPSTNEKSLKSMSGKSDICKLLMEVKKVKHLYNNFVSSMEGYVDPQGLVHTNFNIHGTVTGRLSSDEPNCQQFPRKCNDLGLFQYWNDIKKLFVSRFGTEGVMIQFDYSQLELRILAVYSQDSNLIDLYKSGADLHKAIASLAFGIEIDHVTKDQRTASKKLQFGIVYQESAQGLSGDLLSEGITMSVEECEKFIQNYFKRFPRVQKWVDSTKKHAKRHKQVKTLTGRIRHLPAVDSSDRYVANEALRQCINAPIQSLGSDCTLMSLIIINNWLKETGKRTKMCITVHDSIVFDMPKDEVFEVSTKIKHIMENLQLYNDKFSFLEGVPIVSEMEIGTNYGEVYECSLEELQETGIDGFLDKKKQEKLDKEAKFISSMREQNKLIPSYISV